jgi:hypothetical protein
MTSTYINRNRYRIEFLNLFYKWEPQLGQSSSFPDKLVQRANQMVADGTVTADNVRVWDNLNNEVYVTPEPYVFTEAELAEQAARKAAWEEQEAQRAAEAEVLRLEFEEFLAQEEVRDAEAVASLNQKTISSPKDLDALNQRERYLLQNAVADAYGDSDINGYGDEGAGYDTNVFIQNLLALGWVYQPVQK